MKRIALISDLHANRVALEAVIGDARGLGVDQIICLGDVATLGPEPAWTIERVRELGGTCILGNHDEFMIDADLIHTYTQVPIIVDSVEWCRAQLSTEHLDFIRTFRRTQEIPLDDGATLFLYHGTPRSHMEDMLATTSPDVVDEMLCGNRGTVLAGGHTHIQMMRQHRGMLVVNPGSVGMPFKEHCGGGPPTLLHHAEYAIVEARGASVSVTLRRVDLDTADLRAGLSGSSLPLRDALLEQYV